MAWAQDSKIITGVLNYNNGEYEEAINNLEIGLADPSELKEKNVPKGYSYLAQSYLRVGQNPETKDKYKDPLLKAYEALQKTKASDTRGKYTKAVETTSMLLKNAIYNEGAISYNDKNYQRSMPYFQAVTELDDADYNSRVMLGYTNLMLKDTTKAISYLEKAILMYSSLEEMPETPDPTIGSAYIQGSLLNMNIGNTRKALGLASQGKQLYSTVPDVAKDLDRVTLAIYSQNPDLFEDARKEFEKALKEDPNDKEVKLAYAGLLTQREDEADKARGLELYREVYDANPEDYQANANIGVHYINEAAAVSQKMMSDDTEEDEVAQLEEQIVENLRQAYPYIKKAHELKPDFLEWVNQLVNITSYVPEYQKEMVEWTKKQKELVSEQSGN
jgi:tetratricopeptide (TPR) repeat protein